MFTLLIAITLNLSLRRRHSTLAKKISRESKSKQGICTGCQVTRRTQLLWGQESSTPRNYQRDKAPKIVRGKKKTTFMNKQAHQLREGLEFMEVKINRETLALTYSLKITTKCSRINRSSHLITDCMIVRLWMKWELTNRSSARSQTWESSSTTTAS